MTVSASVSDCDTLTFHKAGLLEANPNFVDIRSDRAFERYAVDEPHHRNSRLLGSSRNRPSRRAAEERRTANYQFFCGGACGPRLLRRQAPTR